jgi:hypothetical protein
MNSQTTALNGRVRLAYEPSLRPQRVVDSGTPVPDYVVDVGRTVQPWRWTDALLEPLELLAVVWSIPFVIILLGTPFVFGIALLYRIGRLVLNF